MTSVQGPTAIFIRGSMVPSSSRARGNRPAVRLPVSPASDAPEGLPASGHGEEMAVIAQTPKLVVASVLET